MAYLRELSLSNFKTFGGTHTVPFRGKFNLVCGPNGSGKSNFLDAIGFVMGAKNSMLRVKRNDELVTAEYRTCQEAWVSMILVSADGHDIILKKTISTTNEIHHYINDNKMTLHDYVEGLKKMQINANLMNFIVFQESIENIITKKPKERTSMFEELSGSVAYKEDYDRLKARIQQLEMDLNHLQKTKKAISAEIKATRLSKEKADNYLTLTKDNENARHRLILFNLHYGKRHIEKLTSEEESLRGTMSVLAKEKYKLEKKMGRLSNMSEQLSQQVADFREHLKPKESEMNDVKANLVKIRAQKQYIKDRIVTIEASLESAIIADNARKSTIQELEDALQLIEQKKQEYFRKNSDALGRDFHLSDTQIQEYENLKIEVCIACANDNQQLSIYDREYKSLQDIFDAESTKKNEAMFLIEQKRSALESAAKRVEKLQDASETLRVKVDNESKLYDEQRRKFEELKIVEGRLREEIAEIDKKLGEFEEDEHELSTMRNKEKIVNMLRQFKGVYNRLGKMCRPCHNRYNVAVTKVLGRNVDAIVVDSVKTAVKCINYLKDNRIDVEIFLPLDNIPECNLAESLRDIDTPRNVKLIYDVINFEPAFIDKAVFFATGNTLVCETPEDASRVAYNLPNGKHDCISLDGCYYRKSGLMSGGNVDLARKARRWEMQERDSLQARKEYLTTRLQELLTSMPKESDLRLLATTISSTASRLKFIDHDEKISCKELEEIKNELTILEERFESVENKWAEAKANMDEAFEKVTKMKSNIEAKENKLFARFCRSMGVESIEEFETGKESYDKTMSEFDKQIGRITDQLEYEKNRDTTSKIERWKKNLAKARQEFESIIEEENLQESVLQEITRELETSNAAFQATEKELNESLIYTNILRDEIVAKAREYKSLSKRLNEVQFKIDKAKSEFHADLQEAKINGYSIVSTNSQTSNLSQTSDSPSSITDTYELDANVKIDFSKLPRDLCDLDDQETVREHAKLEAIIAEQAKDLENIKNPDMKASQHLRLAKEKLAEINERLEIVHQSLKSTMRSLDDVKEARINKFNEFFEHISQRVDVIYKKLTRNMAAQAYLLPENPEEPYLGGIRYECVVPGKRYQPTANLSGGEKAMAALPLLFATQSIDKPPPFQILDEVDAALDHKNANKVVDYLSNNNETRSIIVSHKHEFLRGADTMIGIHRTGTGATAKTSIITLDLSRYRK